MNDSSHYSREVYVGDEGQCSHDPGPGCRESVSQLVPETVYPPPTALSTARVVDEQEDDEATAATTKAANMKAATAKSIFACAIPIPNNKEKETSHTGLRETGPTGTWNTQAHGSSSSGMSGSSNVAHDAIIRNHGIAGSPRHQHQWDERDASDSSRPWPQHQRFQHQEVQRLQQQPLNSHAPPEESIGRGQSWYVHAQSPINKQHTYQQSGHARRKQDPWTQSPRQNAQPKENVSPRHNRSGQNFARMKEEHTAEPEAPCGDLQEVRRDRPRSFSMDGSSTSSVPGVCWETNGKQVATKEGTHLTRAQQSLRTVDENVNMRSSGIMNSRDRLQSMGSMRSIENVGSIGQNHLRGGGGGVHPYEYREAQCSSKISKAIRPGAANAGPQMSIAINHKLEQHFGPTLESLQQHAGGNLSHVRLLNPRQQQSLSPPTLGTGGERDDSDEGDPEVFDTEPVEAEVGTMPRSQQPGQPARELELPSSGRCNRESPKPWCVAPTLVCLALLVAFASISAVMVLVIVQMRKASSGEGSSDGSGGGGGVSFEDSLPPKTLALLDEKDPDSPQYMAYQWIQQDDLFLTYPLWRQQQRFALATLYFALYHGSGDFPWFQSDVNECDWLWNSDEPLRCDSSGRYLILSLRLDYRALSSANVTADSCLYFHNCTLAETSSTRRLVMPAEIGLLQIEQLTLTHIDAPSNMSHLWPPELAALPGLVKLVVKESSGLTGTIPTEVGLVTSLEVLSIERSSITGVIPSEIGQLRLLRELTIIENPSLVGSLPSELGLLSGLELMWIFDNHNVTGSIPTEFGLLRSLAFFSLAGLQMTGTIPSELGLMSILDELRLDRNRLSGTVPHELGALTTLRTFDIDQNDRLSGTMPIGLCKAKYFVDCTRVVCCRDFY